MNSTGAKPIYKYGTTAPGTTVDTSWPAQGIVQLTYDTSLNSSGCWVMNDHIDNTNTAQNQNAFSNVKVGTTTIAADTTTDTLELAAGSNITLTPDATNDKVTISIEDLEAPLTLKDSNLTIGTAPTSNAYPKELIFTDNADQEMGYLQVNNQTNQ